MSQSEKIVNRFCTEPKDFTYNELRTMLTGMGYEEFQGNGSRVKFVNQQDKHMINLHKPHPENILPLYIVRQIKGKLMEVGRL